MVEPEGERYQPNIVFIITDQQRYDTIGALGFEHMETPHLDRLVHEGVAFERCYITAPSCVPSRCSLFQGGYPHTTGVYKNGDDWAATWVSDLARAGYRCVNVGKMHTVPFTAPAGFHERYVVENKDRYLEGRYFFDEWDKALRARGLVKQQRELYRRRPDYRERMGAFTWDLDEDMHSDTFVGGFARWWLDSYPTNQPLFLQVGFPGPHPPYDPVPRWLDRYLAKELPIHEDGEDDLRAQPGPMRALREHMLRVDHDSVVHLDQPTKQQRHYQRACYLANVSMIDEQLGAIMDALARRGILDDTVIVFASDHGDSLGDHGQIQKWNMYEETVRVPSMVWFGQEARRRLNESVHGNHPRAAAESPPDGPLAPPGSRISRLVSLFDLGPTVLELAGVEPPADYESVSLLPLMRSAAPEAAANSRNAAAAAAAPDLQAGGRRYVFAEHGRDNILETTSVMTMVRDERWKLVTFAGTEEGQLFDLASDPEERVNLWTDSSARPERDRLMQVLCQWYRDSLYHTRERRRR